MHQTTVRFGTDLWDQLEAEAARTGVSAAQYIREATLARLSYSAGRRGDERLDQVLDDITGPERRTHAARRAAREEVESSAALWAQGRLARERARELRERAQTLPHRQ